MAGNLEGKFRLGDAGKIKIDPKETGYEMVNSVCLPLDRNQWRSFANAV
jgi:hypothetical protein